MGWLNVFRGCGGIVLFYSWLSILRDCGGISSRRSVNR